MRRVFFTLFSLVATSVIAGVDPSETSDVFAPLRQIEKGTVEEPVSYPALTEPNTAWVESTLAGMTLDEKIGQMIMPQWSQASASNTLATYHVGGFAFLATPSPTLLSATNGLQAEAEVPLLFAIDCEAGLGARVNDGTATRFPMNMALASSGRTDLAFQQGVITASECRSVGIHVGFGPVLDVNTEPLNPIIGIRSFSDDPTTVERMAEEYVRGAESAGLLTTFKHFPGHGATIGDSHQGLQEVDIPCDELQRMHVRPYETLIGKGYADMVMSAHVWYPCLDPGTSAVPATISNAAMSGILRNQIGYENVAISDAFNMNGLTVVAGAYEGAKVGVQAGLDIILFPTSVEDAFNGIRDAVSAGDITEARIDESVRRILSIKSKVGLPEAAFVDPGDSALTLSHPSHLAVAEDIGRDAIAAGPIADGVLPLTEEMNILYLPLDSSSQIFYRYDHSEFGNALTALLPNVTTELVENYPSAARQIAILALAENADRVVVTSRTWQPSNTWGQAALIDSLLDGETTVIYLSFGSPYHILAHPGFQTYFSSFSSHYSSQQEAAHILVGQGEAVGDWPVKLPFNDAIENWNIY